MKVTKKPKICIVNYYKIPIEESYRSEYTCPSCHITYYNGGPHKNVTRFKCENCGQELIVKGNNYEDNKK